MEVVSSKRVPVLRFKDGDGEEYPEWENKEFASIADKVNESYRSDNQEPVVCIGLENIVSGTGTLNQKSRTDEQKSTKIKFQVGDVLFGKLRPYLKKFYLSDFSGVCTTEIWVLRPISVDSRFLFCIVQGTHFIRAANYQFGSKMPRSDWRIVSQTRIQLPSSKLEQQKIAEFLSSIDTRIEQLEKKRSLLEQYKKGLMQMLFSQKIRFEDKQESEYPEWSISKLGELFNVSAGGDIERLNLRKIQSDEFCFPVYANSSLDKGLYGYSNLFRINEECITVTGRGSLGVAHVRTEKFYPIIRLLVLIPKNDCDLRFFQYAINELRIFNESTGVPQLTAPQLQKYRVSYPIIEEQQKIANLLSSIDRQIKLTSEKIGKTREFKKGLFQQMFV